MIILLVTLAGLTLWGLLAKIGEHDHQARVAKIAQTAQAARIAQLKAAHGGKDRYFVRDSYQIKLMEFNKQGAQGAGYYCIASYSIDTIRVAPDYLPTHNSKAGQALYDEHKREKARAIYNDPKRLAHWQVMFENWVETGVQLPSPFGAGGAEWWMLPAEAAQAETWRTQCEQQRKRAICPENSLTPACGEAL